ncbi:MAG TPA: chemotaxis protein CheA, partial [Nitrospiraceae bacterium]|nr:chemotaxis protein CheA [Nitrospiraceae bacterium]
MKKDRPIKEFLAEAEDILENANRTLLSIESEQEAGRCDLDQVNGLFRALHSFKGLAGMYGLQEHAGLAHKAESLLDELRLGKLDLDHTILDVLFETIGLLGRLVQQTAKNQQLEESNALRHRVDDLIQTASLITTDRSLLDGIRLAPEILNVLTEFEEYRLAENIREQKNLFELKATFDLNDFEQEIKKLNKTVKKYGEIICTLPAASKAGSDIRFTLIVGTGRDREFLASAIKMASVSIGAVPYTGSVRTAEKSKDAESALRSVSETVRVDIERLDRLMNMVGELHMTKNSIGRIARDLRAAQGFTGVAVDLQKAHRNLERKLNEIQEGILEVRMVPIGQIFTRLAQAVRKNARDAGKEIDLELLGEETELDKLMIEDLADPLMHLIRNAIDHGIELPPLRKAQAKPEHGKVTLTASPKGNHVVITVADDGAGIDPHTVLATALSKGLVDGDHGLDPETNRKDVLDLIFLPGFTTRDTVSEISGRGVGMDVVKKNVSRLSGMVTIETEAGLGSKFIITLPITLAIIKALIVETGGQIFAVPLSSVLEIVRSTEGQVETIEARE